MASLAPHGYAYVLPPSEIFCVRHWLAGTGLLTATGKPIEIATIEVFDITHGLRFFIRITSVFSYLC